MFQGLFQDQLHFFQGLFVSKTGAHTHKNEVMAGWLSRFTSWVNTWYRGYQLNTISNTQPPFCKITRKHWEQNRVRPEKLENHCLTGIPTIIFDKKQNENI
jgi:hypothetical protein